jgi:hypothetical protein
MIQKGFYKGMEQVVLQEIWSLQDNGRKKRKLTDTGLFWFYLDNGRNGFLRSDIG